MRRPSKQSVAAVLLTYTQCEIQYLEMTAAERAKKNEDKKAGPPEAKKQKQDM